MLRHATVVAYLGLFVALGGTAYAVNTVRSTDIVDGEVKSVDVGNNEIGSADVKDNSINTFDVHSIVGEDIVDGTLTARDVGRYDLFIQLDVGLVPAQGCTYRYVNLAATAREHLLLTPSWNTTATNLIYSVEYRDPADVVAIKACNPTTSAIQAGRTDFKVLVVDSQN